MISKERILAIAKNLAPEGIMNTITEAYDATQKIMSVAQNPMDALNKAGIGKNELEKIEKYTDNPLANLVLAPFGLKSSDMKEAIHKIKNDEVGSSQTASENELEKLRANLDLLKRG